MKFLSTKNSRYLYKYRNLSTRSARSQILLLLLTLTRLEPYSSAKLSSNTDSRDRDFFLSSELCPGLIS